MSRVNIFQAGASLPVSFPYVLELSTDDPEDSFFRTVTHLTMAELRRHIEERTANITAEQSEINLLTAVLYEREQEGAVSADLVFAAGSSLQIRPIK